MLAFIKRQNWTLIYLVAVATTIVVLNLAMFACDSGLLHFGLSPEEARAALTEAGLCKADTPITRREGKLFVGGIECYLPGRVFHCDQWRPWYNNGRFVQEDGRWVAKFQRPPTNQ